MVNKSWIDPDRQLRSAVGEVFPSAQLVVVDGLEVVHGFEVGEADARTVFDIASLTKPLCTATLTMMLCERGMLSRAEEPRPGVTVDWLLCHASGLPAWKSLGAPPDEPAQQRTDRLRPAYLAALDLVRGEPLVSAPGAQAVYSDLGFFLLGAHLEARTGAFLELLFEEQIAGPLGLATRYFPRHPSRCAPCEGLRGVVHDANTRAVGGVAGHAGLFSTAGDVARLVISLLASWQDRHVAGMPRLVSPSTVRAFWSPSGVPGSTWRYGWDGPAASGSSAGERWPKDGVGHLGFTGCSLWLDPPRGRAVVLLSNRVEPSSDNLRIHAFRPRLHDAIVSVLDGD